LQGGADQDLGRGEKRPRGRVRERREKDKGTDVYVKRELITLKRDYRSETRELLSIGNTTLDW
jgi:hypothetical protein